MKKFGRWLYKYAGSLQLAVVIIIGLGIISAWGTITEAKYNTETAQKIVYHSVYMYVLMIFLIINLIASAFHRWPWGKRHIGFVVAHLGIIILLVGSYVTKKWGIDGNIAFGIGESNTKVTVAEPVLTVYVPMGEGYLPIGKADADYLTDPPSEKKPFVMQVQDEKLEVIDFYPYAHYKTNVNPSEVKSEGPAARFQISSARFNMSEWAQQIGANPGLVDLGPARVVVTKTEVPPTGRNEIILNPDGPDHMKYEIRSSREDGIHKKGKIKIGDVIETGWMDIRFRLLNYYEHSSMTSAFEKLEKPTPVAVSAIKIRFAGQEHWMGLNGNLRLFNDEAAYVITYGHRQIELGFGLFLKDFRVGRYEGTNRAATYESDVMVDGQGEPINISMNEPLVHKQYTFYQASFQEGPDGKPSASILSVNYDPGRWLKYLGSFLIVFGSIIMFYFRNLLIKRAGNENAKTEAA